MGLNFPFWWPLLNPYHLLGMDFVLLHCMESSCPSFVSPAALFSIQGLSVVPLEEPCLRSVPLQKMPSWHNTLYKGIHVGTELLGDESTVLWDTCSIDLGKLQIVVWGAVFPAPECELLGEGKKQWWEGNWRRDLGRWNFLFQEITKVKLGEAGREFRENRSSQLDNKMQTNVKFKHGWKSK